MEMQRVWAVYFSGTGTTEKVVTRMAKIAAEDLGAEYKTFCFNLPKDREGELSFGPGDLVIFGTPVYAGRVPNLLLPYIRDKVKGALFLQDPGGGPARRPGYGTGRGAGSQDGGEGERSGAGPRDPCLCGGL